MKTKTSGLMLIIAGIILILFTGLSYVTTEKVIDFGPIQINKEKEHTIQWSPILGVMFLAGGFLIMIRSSRNRT